MAKFNVHKATHKEGFNLSPETKAEYLRQAEGWLARHVKKRTSVHICKALDKWSEDVRPKTFRKMRRALEYHQFIADFKDTARDIRHVERRNADVYTRSAPVCKSVKESDFVILLKDAIARKDSAMKAALAVAMYTDARPKEMVTMSYKPHPEEGLLVHVIGAKKSGEMRGLDREMHITNCPALVDAIDCITKLSLDDMTTLRKRVSDRAKALFPKRKLRPTLYSLRHQFGSDMKADDGVSRAELAVLMGHRSEYSQNVYGNHNSGSNGLRNDESGNPTPPPKVSDTSGITNKYEPPESYQKKKVSLNDRLARLQSTSPAPQGKTRRF